MARPQTIHQLTSAGIACAAAVALFACTGDVGQFADDSGEMPLADPESGEGEEYSISTNYSLPLNAWVKICNVTYGLNNRSGAGTGYMVLRVLQKGSMAKTVARKGNWYKLKLTGGTGWSYGKYLCATGKGAPPPAPGGSCHQGSKFSWNYCSSSCPCGEGVGDCDSNSECKPGLKCAHNVGASYGVTNSVDVCRAVGSTPTPPPPSGCHKGSKFGWDYCSAACPCGEGVGDCDSNAECKPGLKCAHDVGASYGVTKTVDVCRKAGSTPSPGPGPSGGKINVSQNGIINASKAFVKFSYWWGGARFKLGSKSYGKCYSPTYSGHSGSYGADCSGYVGKVWQLPNAMPFEKSAHPYSTYHFKNQKNYWSHISKSSIKRADALVYNSGKSGHILIYESGNAWGKAWAYEARGCSYGVVHNLRSVSSSYQARRRKGL